MSRFLCPNGSVPFMVGVILIVFFVPVLLDGGVGRGATETGGD